MLIYSSACISVHMMVGILRWWTTSSLYLGSVVSSDGEISENIKCRLAKSSHVFGYLRHRIFAIVCLSLRTKRMVYQATVLAVLLYGAETWTLEADNVRCLTVFHICVRTILCISRYKQWQQHLTSATLLDTFGIKPIFLK